MNIYLIERTNYIDYDEFQSFVCYAGSEHEAKQLHPSTLGGKTIRVGEKWKGIDSNDEYRSTWLPALDIESNKTLKTTLLGVAKEGAEYGVIVSSYLHG